MTDNDFADPWGLPSTAESDEEEGVAPVVDESSAGSKPEPPPVDAAPEAEPEPPPEPDEPVSEVPAGEEDDGAGRAAAAAEDQPEPDTEDAASESPPVSSGPYSQVLAAASGLFGRSTTPTQPEAIDVEQEEEVRDVAEAEDLAHASTTNLEDLTEGLSDAPEDHDETVIDSGDSSSMDEVEAALSSLGSDVADATIEAPDEAVSAIDESAETVSVEQIAALASQLEVETPQPYEVSFGVDDDLPVVDAPDAADVADVADAADVADVADVAESLAEADADDTEFSIDMDSAPAVFEQLSESMAENDLEESVAGGFDVGAVFRSDQESTESDHVGVGEAEAEVADPDDGMAGALSSFDESLDDAADTELDTAAPQTDASPLGHEAPGVEEEAALDVPFSSEASVEATDVRDAFAVPSDVELADQEAEAGEEVDTTPIEVLTSHDEDSLEAGRDDSAPSRFVEAGEVEWGARWHESAQGWVEDASGQATWRPIVTTASSLSEWEVDTYLGIVVGDSPVSTGAPMDTAMALSRQHAIRLMVDEALSRGAHAVIGVHLSVSDVGSIPLATATGTAVTLKPGDA